MSAPQPHRSIILFCLRFLALVLFFVVLWWLVLPYYGYLLAQASGATLRYLLKVPIEYGYIEQAGILNTKSMLVYGVGGRESRLPIALLVTNVPPYVALVLATLGLAWKRRIVILLWGTAILSAGHALFIVCALKFQQAAIAAATDTQHLSEVPTAIAQFYLTLPFLLWIVFAYWERIASYLGDE